MRKGDTLMRLHRNKKLILYLISKLSRIHSQYETELQMLKRKRDTTMNNVLLADPKNTKGNIIEEIPSHELYANIVGIPRSSYSETISHNSWDSERVLSHSSFQKDPRINLVPPPPVVVPGCKSEFGKVYQRASEGFLEPSKLSLNSSNKGFQMLEKMGWKESEGGLGKQRQGRMIPLQPSLKLDQKGLGCSAKKNKRKCKSFLRNENGASSIQSSPPTFQKKLLRQQVLQDESQARKRIRVLLRSDLADEYLVYL
jgi:hypothetical protein